MKIQTSQIQKIVIDDLMNSKYKLDPVTIILENIEPKERSDGQIPSGQGKIIVECYGESWTTHFGGMGVEKDKNGLETRPSRLEDFIPSCNVGYLANRFRGEMEPSITDHDSIQEGLLKFLQSEKKKPYGDFTKTEIKELIQEVKESNFDNHWDQSQLLEKILGDDWFTQLASKPNPKYNYLCRIVEAVQDGLKEYAKLQNSIKTPHSFEDSRLTTALSALDNISKTKDVMRSFCEKNEAISPDMISAGLNGAVRIAKAALKDIENTPTLKQESNLGM